MEIKLYLERSILLSLWISVFIIVRRGRIGWDGTIFKKIIFTNYVVIVENGNFPKNILKYFDIFENYKFDVNN